MKIDLYTMPHIEQRAQISQLVILAGQTNYCDAQQYQTLVTEFNKLMENLTAHVYHEETFIHPFMSKRLSHIEKKLHNEHESIELELANLKAYCEWLGHESLHHPKRAELGLELYRSLSRFVISYFKHINDEEYVMQALWQVSADCEILGIMLAFLTYADPNVAKTWLAKHLPDLSLDDRKLLFNNAKLMAPATIYNAMCNDYIDVLGGEEWSRIATL